jgi:hypothetical protein
MKFNELSKNRWLSEDKRTAVIFRSLRLCPPVFQPAGLQAELYRLDAYRGFPTAIAWLASPCKHEDGSRSPATVLYILVPDEERRRRAAFDLLNACCWRWPDLRLTPAISKGGEALIRKIKKRFKGVGDDDKLEKLMRQIEKQH